MPTTLTHARVDDFVLFRIGMTIRKPHRPDLWGPVFLAMPRMLTELERVRTSSTDDGSASGFLGAELSLGVSGPCVTQWWRSPEHLYTYAHDPNLRHLPAWKAFNSAARQHPGAVGIWHETYVVRADGVETLYANGAEVGLARIVGTVDVAKRGRSARERLGER